MRTRRQDLCPCAPRLHRQLTTPQWWPSRRPASYSLFVTALDNDGLHARRRQEWKHARGVLALIVIQAIIDSGRGAVYEQRSPNVGCVVVGSSASAIALQRALMCDTGKFHRKELRANARCAIHPQSIVGKHASKCLVPHFGCNFLIGEQLIPTLAVECVVYRKPFFDRRYESGRRGWRGRIPFLFERIGHFISGKHP